MSDSLHVDFDQSQSALVITGNLAAIRRAPLFSAFLQQRASVQDGQTEIRIPVVPQDLQRTVHALQKIMQRCGVAFQDVGELSAEMQAIRNDDAQFEGFSRRAGKIWNAEFDTEEFRDFVEIVSSQCTGRRFFPMQLLSAYHLAFSQHACNFSVPGAGKTSAVYAAYSYLRSLPEEDPKFVNHVLVVGPLSSFKAWEDEYKVIFERLPHRRRLMGAVAEHERRDYLRGTAADSFSTELTLTSYQSLASLEDDFSVFLGFPRRKVMMVLDEAHYIKRQDGVWSSTALRLATRPASRVVLTGTPAPNGYEDLENLFEFIHPHRRIVGYAGATLKSMTLGKVPGAAIELKQRIRPFYTRIRKKDLGLPPVREHVVSVPLDGSQAEIYSYIEKLVMPHLREVGSSTIADVLARARLIRLRQAATNPSLLVKPLLDEDGHVIETEIGISDLRILDLVRRFEPVNDLRKLNRTQELVRALLGHHKKIIIWSVFVANLELLAAMVRNMGVDVDVISGATPVRSDDELPEDDDFETRERIIDRFLSSSHPYVLVANPQTAGESISLHKECHVAVYYDRDFNAGRYIQSKDRIHRYGLPTHQLTDYYHLVSSETIEEDIANSLAEKEQRLMKLIDEDDIPLFQLVLGQDEFAMDVMRILASYDQRKIR